MTLLRAPIAGDFRLLNARVDITLTSASTGVQLCAGNFVGSLPSPQLRSTSRAVLVALAIVRCVMSSPAAALATLSRQSNKGIQTELASELDEELAASYVYDPTDREQAVDGLPTVVVAQGRQAYGETEKRQLKTFVQAAEQWQRKKDHKLQSALAIIQDLLEQGQNPNRLEQREGRVDSYRQAAPTVKCILLYGQDNPVDGAVLEVLIRVWRK